MPPACDACPLGAKQSRAKRITCGRHAGLTDWRTERPGGMGAYAKPADIGFMHGAAALQRDPRLCPPSPTSPMVRSAAACPVPRMRASPPLPAGRTSPSLAAKSLKPLTPHRCQDRHERHGACRCHATPATADGYPRNRPMQGPGTLGNPRTRRPGSGHRSPTDNHNNNNNKSQGVSSLGTTHPCQYPEPAAPFPLQPIPFRHPRQPPVPTGHQRAKLLESMRRQITRRQPARHLEPSPMPTSYHGYFRAWFHASGPRFRMNNPSYSP